MRNQENRFECLSNKREQRDSNKNDSICLYNSLNQRTMINTFYKNADLRSKIENGDDYNSIPNIRDSSKQMRDHSNDDS